MLSANLFWRLTGLTKEFLSTEKAMLRHKKSHPFHMDDFKVIRLGREPRTLSLKGRCSTS